MPVLDFRCDRWIPHEVISRVGRAARVHADEIWISLESEGSWRTVLALLAEHGVKIATPVSIAEGLPCDWQDPDDQWIAVVLSEGDGGGRCANPPEDYNPVLPPPEDGYVPLALPIHAAEKPTGHIAAIQEDLIVSAAMLRAFGGKEAGELGGPVMFHGKPLPAWHRFAPNARCELIDAISVQPVNCAVCGAPYTGMLGMWIGKTDEPYSGPVAFDGIGYNHLAYVHPMVLSIDDAARIDRHFRGKGYEIEPIYAKSSRTSVVVREALKAIQELT